MSQRKSISRTLAARFDGFTRWLAGGPATVGIVLFAVGVACLDEVSAAAVYAGAFTLGGLLAGLLAVKRGSNQPAKCPSELGRVRVHPVHEVDRNRR